MIIFVHVVFAIVIDLNFLFVRRNEKNHHTLYYFEILKLLIEIHILPRRKYLLFRNP